MTQTRRDFLRTGTCVATGAVIAGAARVLPGQYDGPERPFQQELAEKMLLEARYRYQTGENPRVNEVNESMAYLLQCHIDNKVKVLQPWFEENWIGWGGEPF